MAIIQISPDVLASKAAEVRNLRAQHDETMAKLRNLILGLNENWKGEAQEALVAKFESMQSTFTSFSETVGAYADLMDKTASTMADTDSQLKAAIQQSFS